MPLWLFLDKILPHHYPLVGGKAANLARLAQAGFPIPPGVCITTLAYRRFLESQGLEKKIQILLSQRKAGIDLESILGENRKAIIETPLPEELEEEINIAIEQIPYHPSLPISVALRSSASSEDSALASFAGIHDTYLNIKAHKNLIIYIKRCWASIWNGSAYHYRIRHQENPLEASMSVLIQQMVKAEASGVAFSAHPVTGEHDVIIINASWGLGDAIVSGKVHPDQYIIRVLPEWHGGLMLQDKIMGKKEFMSIPLESATQLVLVPQPKQHVSVLSDNQIFELGYLVQQVAQEFGYPQDIEWTWDGTSFQLLQSRPITTLPSPPIKKEYPILWSRANLKEILPEVPCPLTISWLTKALNMMWQEHYARIGYRLPSDFKIISIFYGRPYFNITLMQRIAADLGTRPSSLVRYIGGPIQWSPSKEQSPFIWKTFFKRFLVILRISRLYRRLPKLATTLFAELKDKVSRDKGLKIEDMSDAQILRYLEETEDYFRKRDLTLAIASAGISSYTVLEWIMRKWVGVMTGDLISRLLTGLGNIETTQQTLRVMSLAKDAEKEPEVRKFFLDPDYNPSTYQEKLEGTKFLRNFEAYLSEFGHRGIYETDTMYPRLAEDPSYLLNIIRGYIEANSIPDPDGLLRQQERIRTEAFLKVKEVLAKQEFPQRWVRYRIFRRIYRDLCTAITLREKYRHHILLPLQIIRKILLELGKRFTERGLIQHPQDLFFLTLEEIQDILQGKTEMTLSGCLLSRIKERKERREANARVIVPNHIWGEPPPSELSSLTMPETSGGNVFYGIGLSPGIATGLAKVLSHPGEKGLKAGEILVAPVVDPSWAPLFGLARGLIVELGGLLSHGSIAAREYGIPAVANIPGITQALRDGTQVIVDGDKGEVRIQ
jgi:pyruvate,water dikinase